MSARDELAEDMRGLGITVVAGPAVDLTEPLAQHLIKAGWVKPRTITTVAELDALPDNSVVLDEMDGPLIKVGSWFHSPTDEMKAHSVIFPAILLYEP